MGYPGSPKRLALVTGAASGIGRATSIRLAQDGYDLLLVDRDEDGLHGTAASVEALGAIVRTQALDLSQSESIMPVMAKAMAGLTVDALVNNAGIGFARTTEQTTLDEWDLTLDVNLKATFIFCKMVLPMMLAAGGGQIVNVASAGAIVGFKSRAAYCASKAGVVGLTRCIAADHAAQGIRVNAIAPGTTSSEWIARILTDVEDPVTTRKAMEARQLDGKMGTPEEVAGGIAFLLGPDARFVNGSLFVMDGGVTAV
jgi:NAD(P)-dependent dehydrogenase (short-subunit alcohol dehydrogenase family)